ncbi:MAG TPA: hypothetical protein VK483_09050 [Chitinophagaceae bacterium]|nr:hypothetical protein [Chitinophagaceae bacterium]
MKRFSLLLACSLFILFSHAQSFKKVPIGNSGCSVYTFCEFKFEKQYSEDSSVIYVGECVNDNVNYGVICVKLLQPADDPDRAEESMIGYLDYLKTSFNIVKSAGYGKGHRLSGYQNTRGVIDYWEDTDKNNWKIKAWTDGKFIAVLYGYSAKELNETKVNVFLEGFRFPGM